MRRAGLLLGSVVWPIALAILAFVIDRRDAVELALALVAVSFACGLVCSSLMRRGRLREERER
jgi:hypothetical protein